MISSVFSSIPEEYISPLIQNISSKSESNDSKTGVCVCLTPEDADECEQERDNGEVERGQNQTTWRGQHVARPELGTWHVACHLDPHDADYHAKCFPEIIDNFSTVLVVLFDLCPRNRKYPILIELILLYIVQVHVTCEKLSKLLSHLNHRGSSSRRSLYRVSQKMPF